MIVAAWSPVKTAPRAPRGPRGTRAVSPHRDRPAEV